MSNASITQGKNFGTAIKQYCKNTWNAKGVKQIFSVLGGSIILIIILTIINSNFINQGNIRDMIRELGPYIIIGIGQALVIITGNIDLSIGSVYSSSAMISAVLMSKNGVHPFPAILVSLIVGVAIGFINGQLVSRFKLPPFIATLGTMFAGRGLAWIVNKSSATGSIADGIGQSTATAFRKFFYSTTFWVLGTTIIIALVVWVIAYLFLSKTKYGRHIYAVGSNKEAARLSGVNVGKTTTLVYMISGFCAALAGIISVAKIGIAQPDVGQTMEMYAVAVAVIGGISTLGGVGILQGVIVGSIMWVVLDNGLNMAKLDNSIKFIVVGVVVVLAVSIDILVRKAGDRKNLVAVQASKNVETNENEEISKNINDEQKIQ